MDVEICRRASHWQFKHYYLGDAVYFYSIDLHLPVDMIYARVINPDMQEFLVRSDGKSHDDDK